MKLSGSKDNETPCETRTAGYSRLREPDSECFRPGTGNYSRYSSELLVTNPRLSAIHTIWADVSASSFCRMADW